jgi:flagellar hook-associated protein 2
MSGITTGVGLVSGINYAELIDSLMELEARPVTTLRTRVNLLDVQRAAYTELSAALSIVRNSLDGFDEVDLFRNFAAATSNRDVMTATATADAVPGTYTFQVHSLVSAHSVISRGFADADSTPVGAGTISIEVGNGRVDRETELDELRGGEGIQRGTFSITDRSGETAEVDLSTALTMSDVLEAINTSGLNVTARVTSLTNGFGSGDRLVIEDQTSTEDVVGNLIIEDGPGRHTAADLGIVADTDQARVDGADLVYLTKQTALSSLNDGNGVGRLFDGPDLAFSTSYGDFTVALTNNLKLSTPLSILNDGNGVRLGVIRITDRSGQSAEIDLTEAQTLRDVRDAINAADVEVSAAIVNSYIGVSDLTDVEEELEGTFTIEDVSGHAAEDLGIASAIDEDYIRGRDIHKIDNLGDIVRAINYAPDNNSFVRASISADGNGLVLEALGFGNEVTVTGADNSSAAEDLGLEGATFSSGQAFASRNLVAGLNTVLLRSLNGGQGVETGVISLTDRAGATTIGGIDLSAAQTLQDVVDLINEDGRTGFEASVNAAGTGIDLTDTSGGNGPLIIQDVQGTLAEDLGIAVAYDPNDPFTGDVVRSGNLQLQYISERTQLATLNQGRGVTAGSFQITDTSGGVHTVNIAANYTTMAEVLNAINVGTGSNITARINDTGDGVLIEDSSGGSGSIVVEELNGGQSAADLNLVGSSKTGEAFVDGSLEVRIEVSSGDTLDDVVRKINEAGAGDFRASVFNSGSKSNPYSLSIASEVTGRQGRLTIDSGALDLGLDTLSEGRDAVVSFGGDGAGRSAAHQQQYEYARRGGGGRQFQSPERVR